MIGNNKEKLLEELQRTVNKATVVTGTTHTWKREEITQTATLAKNVLEKELESFNSAHAVQLRRFKILAEIAGSSYKVGNEKIPPQVLAGLKNACIAELESK